MSHRKQIGLKSHAFQAHLFGTGADLVVRTAPPAQSGAISYDPEEPGYVIGKAIFLLGVPRWMSSHFVDVMSEQQDPGAALSRYSDDWLEKIIYIPNGDPLLKLASEIVTTSDAVQHGLSTGCQRLAPRTTIQAVGGSTHTQDQSVYYAVVSRTDLDPLNVSEITIAQLHYRASIAASDLHTFRLAEARALQVQNPAYLQLKAQRKALFTAIRKLPGSFPP